ncbi:hypothetical protein ACYEXS_19545 [Paenibacillus sp. MAH-36]|uniref:rRNA biogenesis protein rrp5 n=1 Tax=Paenibacillus violae TaxID=3077234 RepID=A0ABU3R7V7_9BACL|nr:hypothetical protein [Paenibacillus sp. PFR10]MDU0200139.1 hypothetical protein [Paenibacillus sp. PFR10]
MNITITIDAPELVAAINNLAAAMSGNGLATALTVPAKESDTTEGDAAAAAAAAAKAAKTAKAAETAAAAATKAAKAATAKKTEPTVTIEEVRAVANQLVQSGKRPQLKELLTNAGAEKLSELNASEYQNFIDSAKELLGDDADELS